MEPRGLSAIPLPYEVDDGPHHQHVPVYNGGPQFMPPFLRSMKQDDIILIFLIVLLLTEGSQCDYLLIGILVFVYLAGIEGSPLGFLGL
ncbi:MAG: hypothetical protein N2376_03105 [Clostridia bacterium]|nr:hypothetical protein [Clostridia bacterium]